MASDYPWRKWPRALVYGIAYSLLAYQHQALSTGVMYFYNELTMTSSLGHEALCHD